MMRSRLHDTPNWLGRLALTGALALLPLSASGEGTGQDAIRFEHLSDVDGLSQVSVFAILQDRKGFMWFGTAEGLNRYDGHRFEIFKRDPNRPDSLVSSIVFVLLEDRDGNLWIGTEAGLSRFDPVTQSFTHYRHDPADPTSLSHNSVYALHQDRAGDLWIGTEGGLDRLGQDGELDHFRHDPGDPGSLSHDYVSALHEDRHGRLWVGTRGGLNRLDPLSVGGFGGSFVRFVHDPADPTSLSDDQVRAIHEDPLCANVCETLRYLEIKEEGTEMEPHERTGIEQAVHTVASGIGP